MKVGQHNDLATVKPLAHIMFCCVHPWIEFGYMDKLCDQNHAIESGNSHNVWSTEVVTKLPKEKV